MSSAEPGEGVSEGVSEGAGATGSAAGGANDDAQRYAVHRTLPYAPREIFALLTDPQRHQETEPTDWVREAFDRTPLTTVGQIFGIRMFHVNAGGEYRMDNKVTVLDPERAIAWEPGQFDESGAWQGGGWVWRYDLAAQGAGSSVTLSYDWERVPAFLRDQLGLPPFTPDFLEDSLDSLEDALRRGSRAAADRG